MSVPIFQVLSIFFSNSLLMTIIMPSRSYIVMRLIGEMRGRYSYLFAVKLQSIPRYY